MRFLIAAASAALLLAGCGQPRTPTHPAQPHPAAKAASKPAASATTQEIAYIPWYSLPTTDVDWCYFDGHAKTVRSYAPAHACSVDVKLDCSGWFAQAAQARAEGYPVEFACVDRPFVFRVRPKPAPAPATPSKAPAHG